MCDIEHVPVGHGGVILAALPLATAVFGSVITREKPPCLFWLICISGFAGIAIFSAMHSDMGQGFYWDDLALLGTVVLAGFGYAQGGSLSKEMKGWEVICWELVLGVCAGVVVSVVLSKRALRPA